MGRSERTRRLIGDDAADCLAASRVLVAGLGGVGGYALEILARTGVGSFVIIDSDAVSVSNINRQLIADINTVGQSKVSLWAARIASVNPDAEIIALDMRLTPDDPSSLIERYHPDFVADAIDSVAPKCALIKAALFSQTPLISSMGAGGRLDPTAVRYADLWETTQDGLARAVRLRLKKEGIKKRIPVVWSSEAPRRHALIEVDEPNKVSSFGTLATVPAAFGLLMGSYIIRKLTKL